MGAEVFAEFEATILSALDARRPASTRSAADDHDPHDQGPPSHRGKLRLDATVVEQGIKYPTDQGLLNEAREISERVIDALWPQTGLASKPRTYRRKARREYLGFAKKRKLTRKHCRRATKAQLQYLRRNLLQQRSRPVIGY